MVCPQVFAIVFVVPRFHSVPFSPPLIDCRASRARVPGFRPVGLGAANLYAAARLIGVTLSSPFFQVSSMSAHCCIILARSPKYSA